MGVRGLTTYIARRNEKYLKYYRLHKTYLVIDGNNLAAQLYILQAKCLDCFGGDYDTYYRAIIEFFATLEKCDIKPLILFDGCYENKKLTTIYDRVQNRIRSAGRLNAFTEGSTRLFPLFLRELFTETVVKLGYNVVRCEYEADYEMACLSRKLNCPILSYDSDFYIFDVLYIPFTTLELPCKRLRSKQGIYYAIDCKLYQVDNFLTSMGEGMDKSILPLLATVLGNDYIHRKVFSKFFKHLKLTKKKRGENNQQRRIETIVQWFRHETYETAVTKILGRVKQIYRKNLANKLTEVAEGYICTESKTIQYFAVEVDNTIEIETKREIPPINVDAILDESDDAESTTSEDSSDLNEDQKDEDGEPLSKNVDMGEVPGAINPETFTGHFPQWFIDDFRKCKFPAWFMDIAIRNRYFFIPQLENYENTCSHVISVPILAALHKILRSNCNKPLTYIARDKRRLRNFKLDYCELDLPTLEQIAHLTNEDRQKYLFKVLNFDFETYSLITQFPSDWAVFIIGIIYWVKNSEEKINNNHIYALILSAITRKYVDVRVGTMRTIRKVDRLSFKGDTPDENNITKKSCANYLKEMIPYFYMDEKMYRNRKLYDICIIDPFSRFQSCLFHIKYLNKLLGSGFDDILISDYYNGTFIYNIFANIRRRVDSLAYLKNVFDNCDGLHKIFLDYSQAITSKLETLNVEGKRRRKRKNRSKSKEFEIIELGKMEADSQGEYDENNSYSMLKFA